MSVDIYSQAYHSKWLGDSSCRRHDWESDEHGKDGKWVMRHKKGKHCDMWGGNCKYRHWHYSTKVDQNGNLEEVDRNYDPYPDCVRYQPDTEVGGHPCIGIGESELIIDSSVGQDFDEGADYGLKCKVDKDDIPALIQQYGESDKLLAPAVIGSANQRVNFLEQILFGTVTKSGKIAGGDGFCYDSANLDTVVGVRGETCYELIQALIGQATADELGYDYCTKNREDIRCACINVTGLDFLERCKQNPTWAGCAQIIQKAADVETLLCPFGESCPTSDAYGGNPDCLAPGICTGTQVGLDDDDKLFNPRQGLPSCNVDLQVCNQLMLLDDISVVGDLDINQSCNIDVDGILKDQAALEAAVSAAQKADDLWKGSEFERQQARQARMAENAREADRIRDELIDAQGEDRDATRTLLGQLVAHRSANTEKRMGERMAWENTFKSQEAQRQFEREQYEASKIAGMDPKTITFFAVGLFCLIFLIIFAVKI